MDGAEDSSKHYRRTFMENCFKENSLKTSAHNYRKLAVQIEKNVARGDWNALAGVELLKGKVKAANALVDDENGINNYADECLANLSKFKNCSKDWKCSISMEDPIIQSFLSTIEETNKESKDISDIHMKRIMKRELTPDLVEACSVVKTSPKESITPLPDRNNQNMQSGRTNQIFIKDGAPMFDLFPEQIPSYSTSNEVKPEPVFKSFSLGKNSPNYIQPQLTSNIQPTGANPPPSKFLNNLGCYNRMTRPIYPPSSSGIATVGGPRQPFNNDNEITSPPSAFKTAHQQLVINNQAKGKPGSGGNNCGGGFSGGGREGPKYGSYNQGGDGSVTPYSYGSGRKNLGTRPGPASGFKPPVKCPGDQGGNGVSGTNGVPHPELEDERYKNIEPKMIELITNEIMDQGVPVTWDDIAGLEFAKTTVQEIVVWPMLRPDIFTGLRGPPKGLLLFGPPGTGKTLIGKCIASQSGSTFFSISASSLTSKWVGEGEKMVRALFAVAKVNQPSVVFIDEIDSLLSSRSDSEHESSRRIKTEFLVQLDGAGPEAGERVLVVGATNRPQELDEAARRRLVKRLYIPLPEAEARIQIINNLLAKERHEVTEAEVGDVGKNTEGYSGADMANLCKEAALGPIRSLGFGQIQSVRPDQVRPINYKDLQNALRQVKASVSQQDLDLYLDWDKKFGAGK